MKKFYKFLAFYFLLTFSACTTHKTYNQKLENCADIKTAVHWEQTAKDLEKQLEDAKYLESEAQSKAQKILYEKLVEEKKYYLEIYENPTRVELKRKREIFPEFEKNFSICEDIYHADKEGFKQIYK